jgi:hypothetical protein
MRQKIAHIALVVKDYDEAIKFYTEKLDFQVLEDTRLTEDKRWVLLAPPGAEGCSILLARSVNAGRLPVLETKQVGGFLFFCIQMISGGIIIKCLTGKLISYALLQKKIMVWWPCLKTFMEIYGT